MDEIPEIYNALDEVRKSVLLYIRFNLRILSHPEGKGFI
jgi:hypothetical protein